MQFWCQNVLAILNFPRYYVNNIETCFINSFDSVSQRVSQRENSNSWVSRRNPPLLLQDLFRIPSNDFWRHYRKMLWKYFSLHPSSIYFEGKEFTQNVFHVYRAVVKADSPRLRKSILSVDFSIALFTFRERRKNKLSFLFERGMYPASTHRRQFSL